MLEKTLESPLHCKEIKPVNPKGNQPWIFIGRTDAEAPILWIPNAKGWLIRKDPDAGKDWRQEEKGTTRECDRWMASPTQRTWVWANLGRQWRTGKPGVLQSVRLWRVGCNWVTKQQNLTCQHQWMCPDEAHPPLHLGEVSPWLSENSAHHCPAAAVAGATHQCA